MVRRGDLARTYDPYAQASGFVPVEDDVTCSFEHYWAVRIPMFHNDQLPQQPPSLLTLEVQGVAEEDGSCRRTF